MGVTEKVIDASPPSQNRIIRFTGTDIFERAYKNIVNQAISNEPVGGQTLCIDSIHLKSSANKRIARNEERVVRASKYLEAVSQTVESERLARGKSP